MDRSMVDVTLHKNCFDVDIQDVIFTGETQKLDELEVGRDGPLNIARHASGRS
jgi:hypothetical protein